MVTSPPLYTPASLRAKINEEISQRIGLVNQAVNKQLETAFATGQVEVHLSAADLDLVSRAATWHYLVNDLRAKGWIVTESGNPQVDPHMMITWIEPKP